MIVDGSNGREARVIESCTGRMDWLGRANMVRVSRLVEALTGSGGV